MDALGHGNTRRRGRARRDGIRRLRRTAAGLLYAGPRRFLDNVPAPRADCDAIKACLATLSRWLAYCRSRGCDGAGRVSSGAPPDGLDRPDSRTNLRPRTQRRQGVTLRTHCAGPGNNGRTRAPDTVGERRRRATLGQPFAVFRLRAGPALGRCGSRGIEAWPTPECRHSLRRYPRIYLAIRALGPKSYRRVSVFVPNPGDA